MREEHLGLRQVMDRIRTLNIKLNPDKYHFQLSEFSYIGHLLSDQAVKPDPGKTAVHLMAPPEERHGLQSFLGMINCLSKFIPGYSEVIAPLCQLLLPDVDWSWQEHHTSPPVLEYFNMHLPVMLSADASRG